MPKRPTPKQRRAKSKGRSQYATYVRKRIRKLENRKNSPYAVLVQPKGKAKKAVEKITRIKA